MTRYKCPHCEEEITYLSYSCQVTEWGSYDIEDEQFNHDDTGDGDSYCYSCPECSEEFNSSNEDVIIRDELIAINDNDEVIRDEIISNNPFKIGDMVECIDNGTNSYIKVGEKYTIKEIISNCLRLNETEHNFSYDSHLFKLVNKIKEQKYTSENLSVQILNDRLLIQKDVEILEFNFEKKDELIKKFMKGELSLFDEDGDKIIFEEEELPKIIELLEMVKNE